MVTVRTSRRGHGEDSIYFDADKNRYVGAVSLGHAGDGTRVRRKVYGKTKQDVRLAYLKIGRRRVHHPPALGGLLGQEGLVSDAKPCPASRYPMITDRSADPGSGWAQLTP